MIRPKILPLKRLESSILFLMFGSQELIHWLQHHLLPCPFKFITGIDCPGCGFQRAFILLLQGEWRASVQLYPPTVPLLLLGVFFILKHYYNFKNSEMLSIILSCLVGFIIIAAYLKKIW